MAMQPDRRNGKCGKNRDTGKPYSLFPGERVRDAGFKYGRLPDRGNSVVPLSFERRHIQLHLMTRLSGRQDFYSPCRVLVVALTE
jgi:hypothetical protein